MNNPSKELSTNEIYQSYYNQHNFKQTKNKKNSQEATLTASAKYIIREVQQFIAQNFKDRFLNSFKEEDLIEIVKHVEEKHAEFLSEHERTQVLAIISNSFEHFDILEPLVKNPEINDIIIRKYNDISVQTSRQNTQTDLSFADENHYKSFIENLLKQVGKSCTLATPVVDASLESHIRICVTHESFCPPGSGPMMTIRIARHTDVTLNELTDCKLAPPEIMEYLSKIVSIGNNTILIAGEVGTGKTTLVKALSMYVPENEAILIIEDTNEINLNRKFVRTLLTREANTEGAGKIPPAFAIRTGLRMAMNRLILGEMRDSEAAEAFIDVCSSGHSGFSTIHARSAKDAISRLELFLSRAQGNVTIDTIRKQIANAVSVIVFLAVNKKTQTRHIYEILEIGSFSDGAVQFSPIYKFQADQKVPSWKRESGVSFLNELSPENKIKLSKNGTIISL